MIWKVLAIIATNLVLNDEKVSEAYDEVTIVMKIVLRLIPKIISIAMEKVWLKKP